MSPSDLAERAIHRRAVEAVIWGMSAVNCDLMYQAMVRAAKGGFNQIAYWSHLPDWKNQTLTPNPDAIYFMPFVNTKDVGPVVLEIPPADEGSITGSMIGGIKETQEMLDYCAVHQILPEVELIKMQEINEAYERMLKGDVHYRFVIDLNSLRE